MGRSPAYMGSSFPHRSLLDDPFFRDPFQSGLRPAVDISEEGGNYILEAELPGVKKENVQVRIGDGGRSVTIEGRVVDRRGPAANQLQHETQPSSAEAQTNEANQGELP